MIVAWFTQPETSYGSYYQYDTVSKRFVRIRLELGRTESNGQPQAISEQRRLVGFTDVNMVEVLDNKNVQIGKEAPFFSVRADGKLVFDKTTVLNSPSETYTPTDGAHVFDCTLNDKGQLVGVHLGNDVSFKPKLPAGIKVEHLQVLANEAAINPPGFNLLPAGGNTKNDTRRKKRSWKACKKKSAEFVARMVRRRICRSTPSATLRSQVRQIKQIADSVVQRSKTQLAENLSKTEAGLKQMLEDMTNGKYAPNDSITENCLNAQKSVIEARKTSSAADPTAALEEIVKAQTSLGQAIEASRAQTASSQKEAFEENQKVLAAAKENVVVWDSNAKGYSGLTDDGSVSEMQEDIGLKEVVPEETVI